MVTIMSSHQRNTGPMLASLRCGAKTRGNSTCNSPAVTGKKRCRMHGGARGSGAPIGNQNALKEGLYSRAAFAEDREVRALIKKALAGIEDADL